MPNISYETQAIETLLSRVHPDHEERFDPTRVVGLDLGEKGLVPIHFRAVTTKIIPGIGNICAARYSPIGPTATKKESDPEYGMQYTESYIPAEVDVAVLVGRQAVEWIVARPGDADPKILFATGLKETIFSPIQRAFVA